MCNWLSIHIAFIILFVQGAALKAKNAKEIRKKQKETLLNGVKYSKSHK